jgi:hypothetical protein
MKSGTVKGKDLDGKVIVSFFATYTVDELGKRWSAESKDVPGLEKEVAKAVSQAVKDFQANPQEVV